MKILLLLLSVMSLTGCVMPVNAQANWYKYGVSPEETRAKYSRCVYDVGMNKVDVIQQQTLVNACMEADGFSWGIQNGYY